MAHVWPRPIWIVSGCFFKWCYRCFDRQNPVAQVKPIISDWSGTSNTQTLSPHNYVVPGKWKGGMWYLGARSPRHVISSCSIFRNISIQALEKHLGRKVSRLIPWVLFFSFFFFFYRNWCQLVTAQGLLLVCHRPVMSCSVPKCLTQPLPKAVRGKSTTSFFPPKSIHAGFFQLLTATLSFRHNSNWHWLIPQH